MDEELIERLRQSGLRLDREGRWWHEGEQVRHQGLAEALHRWLVRLDDGRYAVRFDDSRFAYVEVDDAPYVVRTVEISGAGDRLRVYVHLSDGSDEELAYGTRRVGADNALYCSVKERFDARFSRQAYYLLGELIEASGAGFALRALGAAWPIEQP